jgi:hypothetical protein
MAVADNNNTLISLLHGRSENRRQYCSILQHHRRVVSRIIYFHSLIVSDRRQQLGPKTPRSFLISTSVSTSPSMPTTANLPLHPEPINRPYQPPSSTPCLTNTKVGSTVIPSDRPEQTPRGRVRRSRRDRNHDRWDPEAVRRFESGSRRCRPSCCCF